MNAALKPIEARAVEAPSYFHWNLVQANEKAAWILANWETIKVRFRSYGTIVSDDCTLQEYALCQWDSQRMRYEEMREEGRQARHDYDYEDRDA